jgi:hypothetical protein
MAIEFQERRRSPRIAPDDGFELRVVERIRVRLVDISASGALLATDERLPVGSSGRLHLLLGGSAFEMQVDVTREEPAGDGRGRLAGVAMAGAHPGHQDILDEFLRRAGI